MVSAIWHGFYTGYSIFFAVAGFTSWMTKLAEKVLYPKLKAIGVPEFMITATNYVYLWINTSYWVVAFYLLNWDRYDKVYASMHYCVHWLVLGCAVFLLLLNAVCPPKREKKVHKD